MNNRSLQDIFNVISFDNIDRFMLDFYKTVHHLAEFKEITPEHIVKDIRFTRFEWIDDGKNDLTIKINGKLLK